MERAFKTSDDLVHRDPNNQVSRGRLALAGLGLANILRHTDARRSLDLYDHVFRHMTEIKDNSSFRRFEVSALTGSSYPLRSLGRDVEARQRLEAAFDRLREVKSYPAEIVKPGSEADATLCALADYEASKGNIAGATKIYEKLLQQILAANPQPETILVDAVEVSRVYSALAA